MVELINNKGKQWQSFNNGFVKGFAFDGDLFLEKESGDNLNRILIFGGDHVFRRTQCSDRDICRQHQIIADNVIVRSPELVI